MSGMYVWFVVFRTCCVPLFCYCCVFCSCSIPRDQGLEWYKVNEMKNEINECLFSSVTLHQAHHMKKSKQVCITKSVWIVRFDKGNRICFQHLATIAFHKAINKTQSVTLHLWFCYFFFQWPTKLFCWGKHLTSSAWLNYNKILSFIAPVNPSGIKKQHRFEQSQCF